jgi:subtilisin family serine protease
MSLGGTRLNRQEQRAFDSLYSGGILHVAAAGNEQETTPGALSYPASYSSVMSVAAVDENLEIASFSLQNSAVEIAAPGVGVLSTIPYLETNNLAVDGVNYSANHIEFSAYGSASGTLVDGGLCANTGSWAGKVVLCERGEIDFSVKVMNVQNSGGAAAVIYNNVPGPFLGTLGDATSDIIGISLSQEDGQYLVANKLDSVASVVSQHDWPANGYEAWDGTSMATPHVSGVAALIWSANPSWTNVEIREALTATARDLGDAGRDIMFGFGLVQAKAALDYLGGVTPPPPPPPPPTGELLAEITIPVDGEIYTNRATVRITVSVTSDGTPVDGASVTVVVTGTIAKPTTLAGTTGADGLVSFNYKINAPKTGYGTYTIDVTASKDGSDPVTTSGTFIVQ